MAISSADPVHPFDLKKPIKAIIQNSVGLPEVQGSICALRISPGLSKTANAPSHYSSTIMFEQHTKRFRIFLPIRIAACDAACRYITEPTVQVSPSFGCWISLNFFFWYTCFISRCQNGCSSLVYLHFQRLQIRQGWVFYGWMPNWLPPISTRWPHGLWFLIVGGRKIDLLYEWLLWYPDSLFCCRNFNQKSLVRSKNQLVMVDLLKLITYCTQYPALRSVRMNIAGHQW